MTPRTRESLEMFSDALSLLPLLVIRLDQTTHSTKIQAPLYSLIHEVSR